MEKLWIKLNFDKSFIVDSKGSSRGLCVCLEGRTKIESQILLSESC